MFRAYVFLAVIVLVRAQIPSIGFCPEYLPMADFDIDNFLGKWYETERYFQFTDIASRCVVTDYAKGPSGKIYVSNEVTNRLTGIKRIIDGTLEVAGRAGEGKLNVKYSTTPISSQATLTVLETDYDNYAVIWSCSGFGVLYAQNAWVMTRERLPPGPVLQKVYGVLDKYKISRSFFLKTDQEGCALAASDINAANGITAQSTVPQATGQPQRKVPFIEIFGNAQKSDSVKTPEVIKSADIKPIEAVTSVEDKAEAVKSIEDTAEAVKSVEDKTEVVNLEPAKPEEISPESIIADHTSTGTVHSVANVILEAVKAVRTNSDALGTLTNNEEKSLKVSKVVLENSVPASDPQIKSESQVIPEKLFVPPVSQEFPVAEEVYVPLKTALEDKISITESKTY